MSLPQRATGGCHCGAVRFSVQIRRQQAVCCNCSICTKKGLLHLFTAAGDLEILSGAAQLRTYTFGTHTAKHHFCGVCGVHPFYVPRSHPAGYSVNLRCLDDPTWLDRISLRSFDGRDWEGSIDSLRRES